MNAGILNEVIQIYRPETIINDYGERAETYTLKYTTRANVNWDSGNRSELNDEIQYAYNKTFRVRSYVPVTEVDIIKWQNNRYRILTIEKRRQTNEQIIKTELINE